jgi:hypothetical protein
MNKNNIAATGIKALTFHFLLLSLVVSQIESFSCLLVDKESLNPSIYLFLVVVNCSLLRDHYMYVG